MVKWQELAPNLSYRRLYNLSPSASLRLLGFSLDSRKLKKGEAFIALRGRNFDGHDFIAQAIDRGAVLVIAEHKISFGKFPLVVVDDTYKALGDIAAFLRRKYNPLVIGVTGSLGKTTIKEMLAFVLREKFSLLAAEKSYNNFVGLPQTLLRLKRRHQVCVLELGTNHPGEISRLSQIAHPDIAIISNIAPTHLEFFKNETGVLKEKISIFSANPHTVGVLCGDDKLLRRVKLDNKIVFYGLKKKNDFFAEFLERKGEKVYFQLNKKHKLCLKTWGNFNVYNALACLAAASLLGLKIKVAAKQLCQFKFPPLRLEVKKAQKKGVVFVNDAYNSSPLALAQALKAFAAGFSSGRKIAVLADMLELGEKALVLHLEMLPLIKKVGFSYLILLGPNMQVLGRRLLKDRFKRENLFFASDYQEAKGILSRILKRGDAVLLKGSHAFNLGKIAGFFR